jgi:hypothetical protein
VRVDSGTKSDPGEMSMARYQKGLYQKWLQRILLSSISTSVWAGAPISCLTQSFVPLDVAFEI